MITVEDINNMYRAAFDQQADAKVAMAEAEASKKSAEVLLAQSNALLMEAVALREKYHKQEKYPPNAYLDLDSGQMRFVKPMGKTEKEDSDA